MIRAFVLACALVCASAPAFAGPRVRIAQGQIEGVEADGVRAFRSIPYAAPPVGDLRWRAPQPALSWDGVRDATQFGPSCTQTEMAQGTGPWTPEFFPHVGSGEDCLTLSVWTPAARRGAHQPVLLWIPGGGYRNGGSAVPVNDGAALARRGLVVVTINYRVGAFGFLAHPALAEEDGAGNFGARDALAALRWVRANAAAFGGDANRITIAGQSAGGGLAAVLLTAPEAQGLFARAIIQSAPPGQRVWTERGAALMQGEAFAQRLNARTAAELRAIPAEALLRASDAMGWAPIVDGTFLPQSPWAAFAAGRFADVPMLVGFTAHERSAPLDFARYAARPQPFQRLYPAPADDAAANAAFYAFERDRTMLGLDHWRAARARTAQSPLFLYHWTHAAPGPDAARFRAFHSSEMPYMFGAFDAARPYGEADRAISERMLAYWSNFAKTGDPNGAGLPAWPQSRGAAVFMELGDAWAPAAPIGAEKRDFLEGALMGEGAFQF